MDNLCTQSNIALVYDASGETIAQSIKERTLCNNDASLNLACTQIDLRNLMTQNPCDVAKFLNTFSAVVLCGVSLSNADAENGVYCKPNDSARLVKNFVLSILPPLKIHTQANHVCCDSFDTWIVKDCCGGAYSAQHSFNFDKTFGRASSDTISYGELEIERTARIAYEIASRNITLVDRADLLETARMWRKICADINEDYPYISLLPRTIDNVLNDLISPLHNKNNSMTDIYRQVFLSSNMLGDVLTSTVESVSNSKSSSMLIGDTTFALYTCPTCDNVSTMLKDMLLFSFGKSSI